jgi:hypothetical protein
VQAAEGTGYFRYGDSAVVYEGSFATPAPGEEDEVDPERPPARVRQVRVERQHNNTWLGLTHTPGWG